MISFPGCIDMGLDTNRALFGSFKVFCFFDYEILSFFHTPDFIPCPNINTPTGGNLFFFADFLSLINLDSSFLFCVFMNWNFIISDRTYRPSTRALFVGEAIFSLPAANIFSLSPAFSHDFQPKTDFFFAIFTSAFPFTSSFSTLFSQLLHNRSLADLVSTHCHYVTTSFPHLSKPSITSKPFSAAFRFVSQT